MNVRLELQDGGLTGSMADWATGRVVDLESGWVVDTWVGLRGVWVIAGTMVGWACWAVTAGPMVDWVVVWAIAGMMVGWVGWRVTAGTMVGWVGWWTVRGDLIGWWMTHEGFGFGCVWCCTGGTTG